MLISMPAALNPTPDVVGKRATSATMALVKPTDTSKTNSAVTKGQRLKRIASRMALKPYSPAATARTQLNATTAPAYTNGTQSRPNTMNSAMKNPASPTPFIAK
ncbi:hypothetical protein D3C85_1015170 [compost metagenome]